MPGPRVGSLEPRKEDLETRKKASETEKQGLEFGTVAELRHATFFDVVVLVERTRRMDVGEPLLRLAGS